MENNYQEIIKKFQNSEKDTGSPMMQIINCTMKIEKLSEHMKIQRKDIPAKRTLLKTVATRKKHLIYLKRKDLAKYALLIQALELKG